MPRLRTRALGRFFEYRSDSHDDSTITGAGAGDDTSIKTQGGLAGGIDLARQRRGFAHSACPNIEKLNYLRLSISTSLSLRIAPLNDAVAVQWEGAASRRAFQHDSVRSCGRFRLGSATTSPCFAPLDDAVAVQGEMAASRRTLQDESVISWGEVSGRKTTTSICFAPLDDAPAVQGGGAASRRALQVDSGTSWGEVSVRNYDAPYVCPFTGAH